MGVRQLQYRGERRDSMVTALAELRVNQDAGDTRRLVVS